MAPFDFTALAILNRAITFFFYGSAVFEYTVNDKSFEGEKFRGLLGSSGMWGKVSRFFPSPPSYMSEVSEEQKFSRENFHGLIKIRENRKSFLTVKLLPFTVYHFFL